MDMKNMKMISMANEKEKNGEDKDSEINEPQYPYGLRLTIDGEKWAELVGKDAMPRVGEEKHLMIMVTVTGVRMEMDDEASIDLQVTHTGICEEKPPKKSTAEVMYGGKEA